MTLSLYLVGMAKGSVWNLYHDYLWTLQHFLASSQSFLELQFLKYPFSCKIKSCNTSSSSLYPFHKMTIPVVHWFSITSISKSVPYFSPTAKFGLSLAIYYLVLNPISVFSQFIQSDSSLWTRRFVWSISGAPPPLSGFH